MIQEEAEKWLTRPLEKKYWALYVDGTNFRGSGGLKSPLF
jgi:transposase-like protein